MFKILFKYIFTKIWIAAPRASESEMKANAFAMAVSRSFMNCETNKIIQHKQRNLIHNNSHVFFSLRVVFFALQYNFLFFRVTALTALLFAIAVFHIDWLSLSLYSTYVCPYVRHSDERERLNPKSARFWNVD